MNEYWINVYKYPKLKNYCHSHLIASLDAAKYYSSSIHNNSRKTVYRIHVKMKEPITTTDKDILNRIKNAETRSIRSGKRRMQKIW